MISRVSRTKFTSFKNPVMTSRCSMCVIDHGCQNNFVLNIDQIKLYGTRLKRPIIPDFFLRRRISIKVQQQLFNLTFSKGPITSFINTNISLQRTSIQTKTSPIKAYFHCIIFQPFLQLVISFKHLSRKNRLKSDQGLPEAKGEVWDRSEGKNFHFLNLFIRHSYYNSRLGSGMNNKHIPFKVKYDIEERKIKSAKFFQSSPDHIPLIIEPLPASKIPAFEHGKFSVDRQKTVNYMKGMLINKINPEYARGGMFIFLGKKLLHEGNMKLGQLYELHHDPDGFLYLHYSETNPF